MSQPLRFGKYALQEKIAVGGMAELFKAKLEGDAGFERPVAIKRILPHLAEDDGFVRMFIDEAKIAVKLSHPNVAQILDLGCEDGMYFIAQEYVHGRDVRAIMDYEEQRGRRMPLEIAVHVAMQVCEGLHHAHNATSGGRHLGLIHRDVSPQNILVSYEGEVKVVDFGLAKASGRASQTQAGIVKGKLAYMSPEQARGANIDHRSDIYALGICMFEMITGKRLFLRNSDVETVLAVQNCEVPLLTAVDPTIPSQLESIVLRALASDPSERFPDAMEMHDELELFTYGEKARASRSEIMSYMRELFPEGAPPRQGESSGPPAATQVGELDEEHTVAARPSSSLRQRATRPPAQASPAGSRPAGEETVELDPDLAADAGAPGDTIPSPPDEDEDETTIEVPELPKLGELSESDFADAGQADPDEAETRVSQLRDPWRDD